MGSHQTNEYLSGGEQERIGVQNRIISAITDGRIRLGADGNGIIPPGPDFGEASKLPPLSPNPGEDGAEMRRDVGEDEQTRIGGVAVANARL